MHHPFMAIVRICQFCPGSTERTHHNIKKTNCPSDSTLNLHMQYKPKESKHLLCSSKLSLLITYLQALVSVAQTQLPAGYHGLPGGPGLTTDQTPALRPVSVRAQHLHAALKAAPSACDPDLCETRGLGYMLQSRPQTQTEQIPQKSS